MSVSGLTFLAGTKYIYIYNVDLYVCISPTIPRTFVRSSLFVVVVECRWPARSRFAKSIHQNVRGEAPATYWWLSSIYMSEEWEHRSVLIAVLFKYYLFIRVPAAVIDDRSESSPHV